ncbi:hypothetical protein B0G38_000343 [Arthrobacter sp. VKM Ac-2550]|nr:hypothetical protein [Arthrobacter sp. VKM Ac-2550]
MGILQSWSQGVELWRGRRTCAKSGPPRTSRSSAGEWLKKDSSAHSRTGSSCSWQEGKERIFDVSNLTELDRGRADS